MAVDPHKLRPSELCRLLNSTPLGEVINERQLYRHRTKAGMRIGDDRHVDLFRYTAWLAQLRHLPQPSPAGSTKANTDIAEAAQGAAALAICDPEDEEQDPELTGKQEALIAALLTEPTYMAAATKAEVSESTVYRWLKQSEFRAAYRNARRELVETALGRIQAATGQAVETLLNIARNGHRDSDRVRAALGLIKHALQGLTDADLVHGGKPTDIDPTRMGTADVVQLLGARLHQIDRSDLPTAEKARLSASIADSLLRAIGVDELNKRLEALQAVLMNRKEQKR